MLQCSWLFSGPLLRGCASAGTSCVTWVRVAVTLTGVGGLKPFCQYVIPFRPYVSSLGGPAADGRVLWLQLAVKECYLTLAF